MPQFRSPLIDDDLAVTTARVGAMRIGIFRIGFVPDDTDPLTLPDTKEDTIYAHRDQRIDANGHTVVP